MVCGCSKTENRDLKVSGGSVTVQVDIYTEPRRLEISQNVLEISEFALNLRNLF